MKCVVTCMTLAALVVLFTRPALADDWLRFRGANGSGVISDGAFAAQWDDETNIRWKTALPGPGASSPIVLGDRVYLTCYTGYGVDRENPGEPAALQRHLLAVDRNNGEIVWTATVPSAHDEDPYEGFITEHGYASSTPVTDGTQIYVFFDKTGVAAFDLDGKQVWLTNVGTLSDPYKWGGGASAMLAGDLLIVNAGNVGHAIVALRTSDGTEAWRIDDPEFTNCWGTPILFEGDRTELVMAVPGRILGLDPVTGEELWFAESPIDKTVCGSLVEEDGVVYAMGGRAGDAIGVRCGGDGDVTDSHVVWVAKLRSGIDTPVLANGRLYWASGGRAYCADCEDGQEIFKERLSDQPDTNEGGRTPPSYASPIVIGDKILMVSRSGNTHILAAEKEFKKLGENRLTEDEGPFHGTPAYSDGELFLRSDQFLYCIDE
ncbi:MAG: PQQ-binding-like beta-propeller repeat protein [Planctomycetota bacterium]